MSEVGKQLGAIFCSTVCSGWSSTQSRHNLTSNSWKAQVGSRGLASWTVLKYWTTCMRRNLWWRAKATLSFGWAEFHWGNHWNRSSSKGLVTARAEVEVGSKLSINTVHPHWHTGRSARCGTSQIRGCRNQGALWLQWREDAQNSNQSSEARTAYLEDSLITRISPAKVLL